MLDDAIKKVLSENIPLVWGGNPPLKHNVVNYHRNDGKDPFQEEQEDTDELDLDLDDFEFDEFDDDEFVDLDFDQYADDFEDEDDDFGDLELDGEDDDFGDLDDLEGEEDEDPDRQGLIRVVPNAHLVYKRASEDGTFEELWIYNTSEVLDDELQTRRAILAGTDIPQNKMASEDGSQRYELWTAGNAQLLHITGLPS